jgi:hypothetical protein
LELRIGSSFTVQNLLSADQHIDHECYPEGTKRAQYDLSNHGAPSRQAALHEPALKEGYGFVSNEVLKAA